MICEFCKRPRQGYLNQILTRDHGDLVKVYVVHDYYGCDTGCCGHKAVAEDGEGNVCQSNTFNFSHSYDQDHEEFAKALAAEHFPDIPFSWADCNVVEVGGGG